VTRRPHRAILGRFVLAGVAAAMLIALPQASAAARTTDAGVPGAAHVAAMLKGIPQHGAWLGRSTAPLTLVEFVDLQCPFCARFSSDVLPTVVKRYVRTGRVRILFRGLAFLGADSTTALRFVVAAGQQNRLWNVLELLFAAQGRENSGWVTRARLAAVAGAVPGLRLAQVRRDSTGARVSAEIRAATNAARAAKVPGTPYFQAGTSVLALQPITLRSFEPRDFTAKLDELLQG
jgi:protein-disulfide isomerase